MKDKHLILFVLFLSWATDAFYRFVPITDLSVRRIFIFGPIIIIIYYLFAAKQDTVRRNNKKYLPFLFFYIYTFIINFIIYNESLSFSLLSTKGIIIIFFVFVFLNNENDIKKINNLFLIWAGINAIVCIIQQVFPELISYAQSGLAQEVELSERVRSFVGLIARGSNGLHISPSRTSQILGYACVISFNYYLYRYRNKKFGLLTLILLTGLIFTNRRLMLIATALTMGISSLFFMKKIKKTKVKIFSFLLILVVLMTGIIAINPIFFRAAAGRILLDFNYIEVSTDHNKMTRLDSQIYMWESHFKLFLENPVIGYGNGENFAKIAKKRVHRNYDPHSSLTGILVHFGIIGGIFLLTIYFKSFINYLDILKYQNNVHFIAPFMASIAFMIYQIGGTNYDDPVGLTFIGIGFLARYCYKKRTNITIIK